MKIRAALLVAALAGCQQKPLAEYDSPDGRFKAKFPGDPKVTTTVAVGITLKMYMVESWSTSHMIAWADMPIPDWETAGKTKSRLFDARDGALAAVKGKSSGTTKTILLAERHPGIEFGGDADGKHIRARAYMVGHRMYQILIAGRSESFLTSPEADEFFNGFELTSPSTPKSPDAAPTPAPPTLPAVPDTFAIESTNGRFQAGYPVKPSKFTRAIGGAEYTGYASGSAEGTCSVGFTDLNIPDGESGAKLRERLDAARDVAIADAKGKLTESKYVSLGAGRPGQEFAATGEGKHIRGRVYLVKNRLYQVTVHGAEAFATSKEATAFLDSFQVTK